MRKCTKCLVPETVDTITFDEAVALSNDTGDSRWDHTGNAPITIHIDFKWFPRDALQSVSASPPFHAIAVRPIGVRTSSVDRVASIAVFADAARVARAAAPGETQSAPRHSVERGQAIAAYAIELLLLERRLRDDLGDELERRIALPETHADARLGTVARCLQWKDLT